MQKVVIDKKDSNQTVIKYLKRFLPAAPQSLLYKQIRKKNIVLNDKKITGSEMIKAGDVLSVFMSDETIAKFQEKDSISFDTTEFEKAYKSFGKPHILYEDEHIIVLNKPVGILSQKSKDNDLSVNEWLIGYLLFTNQISADSLITFKPSICNRLDRNTGGLILFGKSLFGVNTLNRIIKDRSVSKYYKTIVFGNFTKELYLKGFLYKDETTNKVTIYNEKINGSEEIETSFKPVRYSKKNDVSELEVKLITGKAHQIRAHLSFIGYPIIGDNKYGNKKLNLKLNNIYSQKNQFLYSYKLVFPSISDYPEISNKCIELDLKDFTNKFFEE